MKSQKGITLISLTVYIVAMLAIVATLATVSGYFFSNYKQASKKVPTLTEYTKFTSFISEEVNKEDIKILICENNEDKSYVIFNNNVQYTFMKENESIYRENVKICRSVENCNFETNNERNQLTVSIKFKGENQWKNMTYTLKN